MGFDLSQFKWIYENVFLFSWDWDFFYPLKKLICNENKNITICSTRWHISGLLDLTKEFPEKSNFLYFNSQKIDSIELRNIIKNTSKWLALEPVLQNFISFWDKKDIKDFYDFIDCLIKKYFYTNKQAKFFDLKNKNDFEIYKIIKNWNLEEKNLLKIYLERFL